MIKKNYILIFIMCFFPSIAFAQVGVNTTEPEASLDINGNLRIQEVPYSTTTKESYLIVDSLGYVKKGLIDVSTFRAYLASDFTVGTNAKTIYRVSNFSVLEDPFNDINTSTDEFTAPVAGYYSIKITVTSRSAVPDGTTNTSNNVVFGLVQDNGTAADTWVMRFSVPFDYISSLPNNSTTGVTNSFIGIVKLTKGSKYYFGATSSIVILANPTGSTGSGIGTFFEIQLIKTL